MARRSGCPGDCAWPAALAIASDSARTGSEIPRRIAARPLVSAAGSLALEIERQGLDLARRQSMNHRLHQPQHGIAPPAVTEILHLGGEIMCILSSEGREVG